MYNNLFDPRTTPTWLLLFNNLHDLKDNYAYFMVYKVLHINFVLYLHIDIPLQLQYTSSKLANRPYIQKEIEINNI